MIGGYETLVRQNTEGQNTLDLLIDGVHCAACIQNIEGLFQGDSNIQTARLNYTSRKLSLKWVGANDNANDYVSRVESLGYKAHPYSHTLEKQKNNDEEKFLLLCLGVAGFAMGNIMLLSVGLWSTDGQTMGMATRDFLHWISALIAIPTIAFSARPFYQSAIWALSNGHTNMDVPISIGITLACLLSLYETSFHGEHVFFDSAVMLIFFLLIGRYLDFRARRQANAAAQDLIGLMAGFADVVEDGGIKRYPISELKAGMVVRVLMGETIPVDGKIVKGVGQIDSAIITGETVPKDVAVGDCVYAGCVNMAGVLDVAATKSSGDTTIEDIAKIMEQASQSRALYVRLADRAAKLYTPVIHTFAAATFFIWWIFLGLAWQKSLMIAISVLIITCPCALGLAVPVVQVLATGQLMRRGVLVKAGDALERLAGITKIVTDKTGTLTLARPILVSAPSIHHKIAASLAANSKHPLSIALAKSYTGEKIEFDIVEEKPGMGLQTKYQGKQIRLGRPSWCGMKETDKSDMAVAFCIEGEETEIFHFRDEVRLDVKEILNSLRTENIPIVLLSGDRPATVEQIAKDAGISEYHAQMMPAEKFLYIDALKKHGERVLMIGDGLNDAPSLAGAYVSIAPGNAIDLTRNAADIVFMGDRFQPVLDAIRIARASQKLVLQNFMIAVVYNLIAIPVAVMGFVTPFVAAVAMSGSSLIVIANSFRLKRIKG